MNIIDEQYLDLLKATVVRPPRPDRTGKGRRSVVGVSIHTDMSTGKFPLLTCKEVVWNPLVVELLWFLRGETNIKYLNAHGCRIWNDDAYREYRHNYPDEDISSEDFITKVMTDPNFEKHGSLGPVYGHQWRHLVVDQIKYLAKMLLHNRYDSGILVDSWNVGQLHQMTLRPCHFAFQVVCTPSSNGDVLSLVWYQRSADAVLGVPFNIASYGLLLSILCKMFNMQPGSLTGHFGDFHIYDNHLSAVDMLLQMPIFDSPTLKCQQSFIDNVENLQQGLYLDIDTFISNMHPTDFSISNYKNAGKVYAKLNVGL